jgi:hypothetical protein
MKQIPIAILAFLAGATSSKAQDEPAAGVSQSATVSSAAPTAARILGKIPDGTPPPPAPPKRKLVIPAKDILATKVHEQGGRTVTIRKIKPLPLPPPPAPAPERDPAREAEFRRLAAEYRKTYRSTELLFLGATVFRSSDAPPRSLVRWWPQNGGDAVTFWTSADFGLIAGGINSFVDGAGETHAIFMSWGYADIDRMTSARAAKVGKYVPPVIPAFPQGPATFQIEGVPPDAEEIAVIQSLHELYNTNHEELISAFQGREQARLAREAYLKAHPPQPKDIVIDYWTTERLAAIGGKP